MDRQSRGLPEAEDEGQARVQVEHQVLGNRADPFDELDGCGDGTIDVLAAGHVDKNHNLWSRNPVKVSASYLASDGTTDRPARETDVNY